MKMIDKYGALAVQDQNAEPYNGVMDTFFAVPGVSGTSRLKIKPPADADEIEIRRKMEDEIVYYGQSPSVSSQEPDPRGIVFNNDGYALYLIGNTNATVYQYTLATAWDVSTAVYSSKYKNVSSQEPAPRGVSFSYDGYLMYVVGNTNSTIYLYMLSTAWDVSTAVYSTKSFYCGNEGTGTQQIRFNKSGTICIVAAATTAEVYQYTLSTAWDISTSNYSGNLFDPTEITSSLQSCEITQDGKIMFLHDNASTTYKYILSTAWDISTATYFGVSKDMSSQSSGGRGISLGASDNIIYYVSTISDIVYQYGLGYGYWNTNDTKDSGILVDTIEYYSSSTTYSEDDWIIYQGNCYRSLLSSNIGNTPDISPSYWVDASDLNNNEWYVVDGLADGVKYYYHCFVAKDGTWKEPTFRPSGIVHEYKLDYNAADAIGANDGTETNVAHVAKNSNSCAVFNGTSSYIDLGAPSTFDRSVKTAGNGCAYECWVNLNEWGATSAEKRIIVDKDSWMGVITSDATGVITGKKQTSTGFHGVSKSGLSLSKWYHCVLNIYDNYNTELFIDGVSAGLDMNNEIPDNLINGIFIGCNNGTGYFCNGEIDNVRLYSNSLTSTEIQDLYEANAEFYKGNTDIYTEPESLPTSLVHYYKLNGNAIDSEGSNDGTASNVTYEAFVYEPKECAEFNGSSSYINLGSPSDFDRGVKTAGNGCAYECWFSASAWGTSNSDGNRKTLFNDWNEWNLFVRTQMSGEIAVVKGTASNTYYAYATGLSLFTWYHCVVNYNNDNTVDMYIDGVLIDSIINTDVVSSQSGCIQVGKQVNIANNYWDGKIDNVRLYNRSLTSAEIAELYNDTFEYYKDESIVKAGGLVHEYTMDSVSGATVYDTAGSTNITASNVSFNSGKIGYTAQFNGSTSYMTANNILSSAQLDATFAISFIYTHSSDNSGYIVDFFQYRDVWIKLISDNMKLGYYDGTEKYVESGVLAEGETYHIAWNRSKISGLQLFINGILADIDSSTGNGNGVGLNTNFGRHPTAGNYLAFSLDQFRIFPGRVLTPYEITSLYNNGKGC